ncbi:hypothetical protein ULMS_07040 [Patiriisocius marinistellae]|uniref:C1q domain-containing protein n=1 Tax=Patiriisocius marinistellae TaxID=2494560 RepID=A0A5J4FYK1_9FLAO|nr:hypothetical protein [Patiriisocius marinistellae]GEQ85196.1 hypothetical protein ULMS_07040 [Patiriisocius marinistellae]
MKTILITISAVLISLICFAQNGINYKALIKNTDGNTLVSQDIIIQFQILENGTTNVYQETHDTVTDANGIVAVNIGEGTVGSGSFSTVNWSFANHFLNVQVDSGDGFVDLGTTEFKSVPYAKVAETVIASPVSQFPLAKANASNIFIGTNFSKVTFNNEIFDITENYEPNPSFSNNPQLSRFNVTEAGYYSISADATGQVFGNSIEYVLNLAIYKNGSSVKIDLFFSRTVSSQAGTSRISRDISSIEYLVPGDYIEIYASKSSAVSMQNFFLEIERIR